MHTGLSNDQKLAIKNICADFGSAFRTTFNLNPRQANERFVEDSWNKFGESVINLIEVFDA